jgi:hypothetical protein
VRHDLEWHLAPPSERKFTCVDVLANGTPVTGGPPRDEPARQDVAMRRWLSSVAAALAVLGVAGCVPERSPTARSTRDWRALVVPSGSALPSPACPPGTRPVHAKLPQPTDISVRVYNATSRPALATQVATELTARGLTVLKVADSDRPYPQTLLRHGPDGLGAAWLLRAYFPDARTDYEAQQQGPSVDVIVGPSFVKVPAATEINRAIAQNGTPVLPPGTCPA